MTASFSSFTSKDIAGYDNKIFDLKWNAEGNYLACVLDKKNVKIGQLDNNNGNYQNIHNLQISSQMTQLCWNPMDQQRLALCGEDKSVELWDVRSSRSSAKIISIGCHFNIAWSCCGNYIATGNKYDVLAVLDARMCTLSQKKKIPYQLNELAWTYDSNYILAATGDDRLGAIDIIQFNDEELSVVDSIVGHTSNCCSLTVDSQYQRLALGGKDFYVSMWDLEDLSCRYTIAMDSEISGMSFSGDGSFIAISANDPNIVISNVHTGESLHKITCRYKLISLAWHPKQNLLSVGHDDKGPVPQFLKFYTCNS